MKKPEPLAIGPSGEPINVLVADDCPDMRALLKLTLRQQGFSVHAVEDGQAALDVFRATGCFNIVLLDGDMPHLSGFEACAALRAGPAAAHLPIVLVTSLEDVEFVTRAYEAGATDYMLKPIHRPVLGHRLRYWLQASHAMVQRDSSAKQLAKSRASLANAQRQAQLGNWDFDRESGRFVGSDEFFRILGADSRSPNSGFSELLQRVNEADRLSLQSAFEFALKGGSPAPVTHDLYPNFGEAQKTLRHTIKPALNERAGAGKDDDLPSSVHGTVQDITAQHLAAKRIHRLAYFDQLTGLPNREAMLERLTKTVAFLNTNQTRGAVLLIDLSRFRRYNETLGHSVGDELLRSVAARLWCCVARINDMPLNDSVFDPNATDDIFLARVAGDEFVALLLGDDCRAESERVFANIQAGFARPFNIANNELFVGVSVGVSMYPEHAQSAPELLRSADIAVEAAKQVPAEPFRFFDEMLDVETKRREQINRGLLEAIKHRRFSIHYQPQMALTTYRICGVEALLRWHDPELGDVSPTEFIPVAEESGLIVTIGEWVLRTACAQATAWRNEGVPRMRLAVNVSVVQFARPGFPLLVEDVLRETGFYAEDLELEITESVLAADVEGTVATLQALKALGVHLAVDDFGTGYSSLSQIKRFPIDRLKIDRSFVNDISSDPDDAAIALAVISMAESMKLDVIAEGVETSEQVFVLESNACDEVQGYLLGGPVPPQELVHMLRSPTVGSVVGSKQLRSAS